MSASGGDVERRFSDALERARGEWATADPAWCAAQAGCRFTQDGVLVPLFGRQHLVTHPDGEVTAGERAVSAPVRILLLHYLLTADGTPLAHEWRAFRDLPDGLFYARAFAERSEKLLAAAFGRPAEPGEAGWCGGQSTAAALDRFQAAAAALGGTPLDLADAACAFDVLPRLRMAVLVWAADEDPDEDIPARASIVFDGAAGHYLRAEDLAGLGELLARRLASFSA